MEMQSLPTQALITLLKQLEDTPDFNFNSIDYFLRLDDPHSPPLLNQLWQAVEDMGDDIPVFRREDKFKDSINYLAFSKYVVERHVSAQGSVFFYIPTSKGRVRFPDSATPMAMQCVKLA